MDLAAGVPEDKRDSAPSRQCRAGKVSQPRISKVRVREIDDNDQIDGCEVWL